MGLKHPELAVLTEIESFFLSKCCFDCCMPLVNFYTSEKIDFDKFCQCSL